MVDALDELHLAGKHPQQAALSLISLTSGATLGAAPARNPPVRPCEAAMLMVFPMKDLLDPDQPRFWRRIRCGACLIASTCPCKTARLRLSPDMGFPGTRSTTGCQTQIRRMSQHVCPPFGRRNERAGGGSGAAAGASAGAAAAPAAPAGEREFHAAPA